LALEIDVERQTKPHFAVLGLGRTGTAVAGALLRRTDRVTVWNRTPGNARRLAEMGARPVSTPADAVADATCAIVCVSHYAATDAILASTGFATAIRGSILIQLSAGDARDASALAAWSWANQVDLIDGHVSGSSDQLGTSKAHVYLCGALEHLGEVAPDLAAIGTLVPLDADPASANRRAARVHPCPQRSGASSSSPAACRQILNCSSAAGANRCLLVPVEE
jgi:3-hydroxyisobutyrate dehydrogenase-like beta-hydroxyacid dehydrogenase